MHHARVESRRNRPEAGGAELCRRCAEIRGVEQVEDLDAQLDGPLPSPTDASYHGQVDVVVRRPSHRVPRYGADRQLIGLRECGRVEPATNRPFCGKECRVIHEIRTLCREAGVPERVSMGRS